MKGESTLRRDAIWDWETASQSLVHLKRLIKEDCVAAVDGAGCGAQSGYICHFCSGPVIYGDDFEVESIEHRHDCPYVAATKFVAGLKG